MKSLRSLIPLIGTLSCVALVTALSGAALANDVNLASVTLTRESSAPLTLNFTASPEPVVALQFDIDFDPSAIQLTATVGEAARAAGKSLYVAAISPKRSRFILAGLNQTAILDGPLIRFLAGSLANAPAREYALSFSNVLATTTNGFSTPTSASGGAVTVVSGSPVRLTGDGVMNAATFMAGAVAPGEIATLIGQGIGPPFGAVPETGVSSPVLGGTSVWFDGVQAPLLYTGPNQINVVVPFGVTGGSTGVVVRNGGLVSAALPVSVATAAPGLFTLSASGVGPAAIVNQNATINSATNPALRGQVISIFATGAGAMDPPGEDSAIAKGTSQHPILPVTVRIGGMDAEVLYAGSAPGLIEGALQVNCKIPAEAPTGAAVEILLKVGNTSSPAGVTLSIQ